jgi:hypothetical protein
MDPARATAIPPSDVEALFQSVIRGDRGQKLRTQLAGQHPESSAEEIEEAIQIACKRFVDKAEGISAPGQVYVWIRTTAHRALSREAGYEGHELPVDPTEVEGADAGAAVRGQPQRRASPASWPRRGERGRLRPASLR